MIENAKKRMWVISDDRLEKVGRSQVPKNGGLWLLFVEKKCKNACFWLKNPVGLRVIFMILEKWRKIVVFSKLAFGDRPVFLSEMGCFWG